jgi:hypothetical protein
MILIGIRGLLTGGEMWRRSAQAETFTESDWSFLLDTALMHHAMWSKGQWTLAAEVRLRVAKFGATPEDRARLRMVFADADEKDEKRAAKAHRRLLELAAVRSKLSDAVEAFGAGRGSDARLVCARLDHRVSGRPGKADYEPFVPYREQEDFILRWYEIDPGLVGSSITGVCWVGRAVGVSPRSLGALRCVEGLPMWCPTAGMLPGSRWVSRGRRFGRRWCISLRCRRSRPATRGSRCWRCCANGPVIDEYRGGSAGHVRGPAAGQD